MTLTFDRATTYRTRAGCEAYINELQSRTEKLYGHINLADGDRIFACWYPDGHIVPAIDGPYDLIHPSVVHPMGPREVNDPEYDVARLGPNGSARREANIEVDMFGGSWPVCVELPSEIVRRIRDEGAHGLGPKHENVTDRIDRIEQNMESGRRGLIYRLDQLDKRTSETNARLAKSDEEAALNLVATDARLDRLSGMVSAVDNRVDHLSATVTDLLNLPGLATLNAAKGWINVYDRGDGEMVAVTKVFPTKDEADRFARGDRGVRIACVPIHQDSSL